MVLLLSVLSLNVFFTVFTDVGLSKNTQIYVELGIKVIWLLVYSGLENIRKIQSGLKSQLICTADTFIQPWPNIPTYMHCWVKVSDPGPMTYIT